MATPTVPEVYQPVVIILEMLLKILQFLLEHIRSPSSSIIQDTILIGLNKIKCFLNCKKAVLKGQLFFEFKFQLSGWLYRNLLEHFDRHKGIW